MNSTLKKKCLKPFLHCKNSVITEANTSFTNLTGYLGEELIGKSIGEMSSLLRINSQINVQNIRNDCDCYIFTKCLKPKEVTISCELSECDNEKVFIFNEKPNSRIEEKFAFFQKPYEINKVGIAIYSFPDIILLEVNQRYLNFWDAPYNRRENCIGKKHKEIVTGYERNSMEKIWENVVKTHKPFYCDETEYEHYKRGLTYWDSSIIPIYIEGKVKYIIDTSVDVTDKVLNRKLLEEQTKVIEEQKKELEAIIKNMSDGLFTTDKDYKNLYLNSSTKECCDVLQRVKNEENLLIKTQYDLLNRMIENLDINLLRISYPEFVIIGINQKGFKFFNNIKSTFDIKGKNLLEFMDDNKKAEFLNNIQDIIDKKSASYLEIERYVLDGEENFVKKLYQPVFGLNNEIQEIVIISFDVTKEIKASNQMEKNLKMQEELFANISHELKTPLNVIFSTSQLFELYIKNGSFIDNKDKILKNIHGIRQNCYRLTKLIGNIVDVSKIKSGFFELNLSNENVVDITEEIVQSISEYVEEKGFHITFDTEIEEKIIACDPEKIERILLNLISNAIKFSEFGDEIFVNFTDKGESVEISVKDRGIGIDKNHLDAIFQRFHQENTSFTRNAEGSGIGLYLVKSIVEMHGGKISAESKLGEGSIFKIELPSRIIEKQDCIDKVKSQNSKVERINIEFSDVYSM